MDWIERTFDYPMIRRMATHPMLYEASRDDFTPPASEYSPVENDAIIYLAANVNDIPQGILMMIPFSPILYDVHISFLPEMWGEKSIQAARAAFQWMWDNTPCVRIQAQIPEDNTHALQLALNSGMIAFGKNDKCYLKQGMLRDMILLGISKGGN